MLVPNNIISELSYKAVRSSGSGGQHVNKVATKVELYFNLWDSKVLTAPQKQKLAQFLNNKLTQYGVLVLSCGDTRSQLRNKQKVTQRFIQLLSAGLTPKKKRMPSKIPKAIIRKRLEHKKRNAQKKQQRKPPKDFT